MALYMDGILANSKQPENPQTGHTDLKSMTSAGLILSCSRYFRKAPGPHGDPYK